MKDLPAIFWIFLLFFLMSVGTLLYSLSGPKRMPEAVNYWAVVDDFKQAIEMRRITLKPGGSIESTSPPYRLEARRLADAGGPPPVARYVLTVLASGHLPVTGFSVNEGVNIGLVDSKPGDSVGSLRLVALQKLQPQKTE